MHINHDAAHRWFAARGNAAWATCPLTENGFVRIASHPSYPNRPGDAPLVLALLRRFCTAAGHQFFPDDQSLHELLLPDALFSHNRVTDLYLLGLAAARGAKLVTFDQQIATSAVQGGGALELITAQSLARLLQDSPLPKHQAGEHGRTWPSHIAVGRAGEGLAFPYLFQIKQCYNKKIYRNGVYPVMSKPIIGISCGSFVDRDWCPPFVGLRKTYVDAVATAGGAPLLIPLVEDEVVLRAVYERVDGLLLSGGGDVDPTHYGEEPLPELGTVDPLRDRVELQLARWAAADGKPVLGICRGVQVLNVALGGSLYQDIPVQIGADLAHNGSYAAQNWAHLAHDMRLAPESRLAGLFGTTTLATNSLHHQSIKRVAPGLRPVGWAPDGVVEAVEGANGHFLVGVQCHPEALQAEADPRWQNLFRHFVERCRTT
jgi:putative glutamine amidotransferase